MKKFYILPIAMLIVILAMTVIVSAKLNNTILMITPLNRTNHTTTMAVNVTWKNISMHCRTGKTAATIFANVSGNHEIIGVANFTCVCHNAAMPSCNATLTTTGEIDGRYTLNVSIVNDTTAGKVSRYLSINLTQASKLVAIDNTKPVILITTDYKTVDLRRVFRYTVSISDATTGTISSNCTLYTPTGHIKYPTIALSTDNLKTRTTVTYTDIIFDDTSVKGDYNITCRATDYVSRTNTNSTIVTVDSLGRAITPTEEAGTSLMDRINAMDSTTKLILGAVLVVGLWWLLGKK